MFYQRNVIASFDSRNDANLATRELLQARLGDISLRILPPPSARRADGGRVIVSAIVASNHLHEAEAILARYGHLDLSDEDRRSSRPSSRRTSQSGLADLPWGSLIAGGAAVLAGWALMSNWRERPGASRMQRRERPMPSGVINTNTASDIADSADLAWGDEDTPRPSDARPAGQSFQTGAAVRRPSTGEGLGAGSGLGSGSGLGAGTGTGSAAAGSGYVAGTDLGVGAGVGGRHSSAGMAGRDLERAGQRTP